MTIRYGKLDWLPKNMTRNTPVTLFSFPLIFRLRESV
jgi:hypothetical protein